MIKKIVQKIYLLSGLRFIFHPNGILTMAGLRIRVDGSAMSKTLSTDASYYDEELVLMSKFILKGDIIIDVGANIGLYACHAAIQVGETGLVIACEPEKTSFQRLVSNIYLNNLSDRMLCMNTAVGSTWARGLINFHKTDDSQNSVTAFGKFQKHTSKQNKQGIVISPLDSFTEKFESIGLLKIDVEGAELAVLQGAKRTLKKTRAVCIELFDPNLIAFGTTAKEILLLLTNLDFHVYRYLHGQFEKVSVSDSFPACHNVIAIHNDNLDVLKIS